MRFSAGWGSTVLAHLALRASYPSRPPFPLLQIDSTWEFRSLLEFSDSFARQHGLSLIVHANEACRAAGIILVYRTKSATCMPNPVCFKNGADPQRAE
jgi:sulfate adenylyltransferase subunit 2